MKRKFYLKKMIIPLILLSVIKINAQQWVKIIPTFNPSGIHSMYSGVFLDEFNGWYSDNGNIFKTSNGGLTWDLKLNTGLNTGNEDYIFFIDSLYGWILFNPQGDSSIVYKTSDGGQIWKIIKISKIGKLFFIDYNNGVGIHQDRVYKTTNGGETWNKIELEPYEGTIQFSTIFFLNEKKGWIVGTRFVNIGPYKYPVILSTNNGGDSWGLNYFKTDYDIGLLTIAFSDSLNGVVSENLPYYDYTNDGGKNWTRDNNPLGLILNILFTSENEGWMTGAQGFIGHSTDKGKTWEKIFSPTNNQLGKISFVKNNTIGFIYAGQNTLLRYEKPVSVDDNDVVQMPTKLILYQNYPNPFNLSTVLTFELPENNFTELKLYDFLGRVIKVIEKGFMNKGEHKVLLNVQTLSSGTYFCVLTQGNYFSKIKLVLIK